MPKKLDISPSTRPMITQNVGLVICLPWMRALNKVYTKVPMVIMARQIDCTTPTVLGLGNMPAMVLNSCLPTTPPTAAPNGQRGAGAEIHPVIASGNVFAHGVAAHGKHGAP